MQFDDKSERALSGSTPRSVTARDAGLLGIVLLASACSGSEDNTAVTAAPEPLQPAGSERDPLYVVGHTVYSAEGASTYLTVLPSLAGDVAPDTSRSLEISGAAVPYGIAGSGKVFVSSQEAGTMTEVMFDERGAPAPGHFLRQPRDQRHLGPQHLLVADESVSRQPVHVRRRGVEPGRDDRDRILCDRARHRGAER
jgi:hypothetical protein